MALKRVEIIYFCKSWDTVNDINININEDCDYLCRSISDCINKFPTYNSGSI